MITIFDNGRVLSSFKRGGICHEKADSWAGLGGSHNSFWIQKIHRKSAVHTARVIRPTFPGVHPLRSAKPKGSNCLLKK